MTDDGEQRPHRWFEPYAWAFGGGAVIGLLYALLARPAGEVFLTDSWSYVPKDDWWLHAVVVGVSLCVVYLAIVLGYRLVGLLFRHHILFTAVGALLIVAGAVFFGRAIWGGEGTGGTIAWIVMGLFVIVLGVPMIVAERRSR